MKQNRNDWIVIGIMLLAAVAFWAGLTLNQEKSTVDAEAVVTIDGELYGRFALNEDRTERIELPDGSYNVLEIKDGEADILEASCPDGICVNHRKISKKNQSIVCLPNKVVVLIENGVEAEIDSSTN